MTVINQLVDTMNGAFLQAYEDLQVRNAAKTEVNTNEFRTNHFRMDLPLCTSFIDPLVMSRMSRNQGFGKTLVS